MADLSANGTRERRTATPGQGGTDKRALKFQEVFEISLNFVKKAFRGIVRHKRKLAVVLLLFISGGPCIKGLVEYSNSNASISLEVEKQEVSTIISETRNLCQRLHILLDADTGECRIQNKPILRLGHPIEQQKWGECDRAISEKFKDKNFLNRNTTIVEQELPILISLHQERSARFKSNCALAQSFANDHYEKLTNWSTPGFIGFGIFLLSLPWIVNRRLGYTIISYVFMAGAAFCFVVNVGICRSEPDKFLAAWITMHVFGSLTIAFSTAVAAHFVMGFGKKLNLLDRENVGDFQLAEVNPPAPGLTGAEADSIAHTMPSQVDDSESQLGTRNDSEVSIATEEDRQLSEHNDNDETRDSTAVIEDQNSQTSNLDHGASSS